MPTYVLPQVLVFQDFQLTPAAVATPLRAHISGGHAKLIRFAEEDEREDGELGCYDPLLDVSYLWPSRPAGGEVDDSYTKLYAKDAILKYFEDTVAGGDTIIKTAGKTNQISAAATNFKTSGIYSRDADLYDRDVQVGDVVKARFITSGGPATMWSKVSGFVADAVDSVIAAAGTDTDNAGAGSAASTDTQIAGVDNGMSIASDPAAYSPYATGQVTETYTVYVTQSSTGGDLTTGRLRVVSASGLDDVDNVTPAAGGVDFAIGTQGLVAQFNDEDTAAASLSAANFGVSSEDIIAGQVFTIEATGDYTAETAASNAGTDIYTGEENTTYIVEVTRGGLFASGPAPQISVTTTTGVDISGPTTVNAAATAIAVGTKAVTVTFTGDGLLLGNKWTIGVTAEGDGPVRTIKLANSIPSTVADSDPCDLTLYIHKPELLIAENREGFAPLVNYETSDTEIEVKSGIQLFDDSWTDGGTPLPLELDSQCDAAYDIYTSLYAEVRYWLSELSSQVTTIDDVANIDDIISGPLDPDNPLKWGVFKALSNSNGVEVKFTAVGDPSATSEWVDVLELIVGRDDVYGLVPLTRDRTVLDLFAAHCDAQSAPEQGLWRVLWLNLAGFPEIPIIHSGSDVSGYVTATTTDGEVSLGTITDDPDTTGTQYTILTVPADNADFVTNDVRPGDIVRTLYTGDGFGNFTYSEYVVDQVNSENELRLLTGPGAAVNTAAKFEIWRNLTATEEAAELARDAGAWNNRRVRAVWPDTIESSGTVQEGYHLCAALAGLRSGILPHQGMTNLEIAGFSDVPRTVDKFNRNQLDVMAVAGTYIVTQNLFDGEIYSRHAVTTDDYEDINKREEMVQSNVDSISFRFKDQFAPYIGVTNVTPNLIELLRLEVKKLVETLQTENSSRTLGGQLIDGVIQELRQHPTLKDRVVLKLETYVPAPFNNFEINLLII